MYLNMVRMFSQGKDKQPALALFESTHTHTHTYTHTHSLSLSLSLSLSQTWFPTASAKVDGRGLSKFFSIRIMKVCSQEAVILTPMRWMPQHG